MTAASPDVAAQIAALEACIGRCEVRGELVPYDGPEPDDGALVSANHSERLGLIEENRTERSRRWFER